MKILNVNQINEKNKHLVGNKAFNLSVLIKHGIDTAKFFVITTQAYDQITTLKTIKLFKKKIGKTKLNSLVKNQDKIRKIFGLINNEIGKKRLSSLIQKLILTEVLKLSTDKIAVRSSATCEDGINSSFAGQFQSYLPVFKDEIFKFIKKCWSSVFNLQVLSYCLYHQINFFLIKMAVIVQELIEAEKGGVIFTTDIFNQEKNMVVIEAVRGLGEKVVSGLVNPQRLVFSKKKKRCVKAVLGFKKQVLTWKEANKLFKLALKIEKVFGKPQDIEWAIKDGKIYILQSRPLTNKNNYQ